MNRNDAEENLRVIRSLMEKATIYRTISVPTAFVGGVASVIAGFVLRWYGLDLPDRIDPNRQLLCLIVWLSVLGITGSANAWFIWKDAQRREEPFISPQMKKALWALFPPLLAGAVGTWLLGWGHLEYVPPMWMVAYGLALLATAHFAPQSIPRLGSVFLVAGLAGACLFKLQILAHTLDVANGLMMLTFGCFHLIYAFCVWRRNRSAAATEN